MIQSVHVGNIQVVPLLDAVLPNPVSEAAPGQDIGALREAYPDLLTADEMLELPVTCYLLRSRGRTVLVDTGIGPRRRGSWPAGRLDRALSDVGLTPLDIDLVLNTHLHVDHIGWNTTDNVAGEAQPWFPNARYLVQEEEWAYWSTTTQLESPDNVHIRQCVASLFGLADVSIMGSSDAIDAGLTFVPLPGHTPGHVGVGISSAGERAIVIGDASHYLAQLDHTDWSPMWDLDRALAARTRASLFDWIELEEALVGAGHWPFPGMGRLVRVAGRRVFRGVSWSTGATPQAPRPRDRGGQAP